MHWNYKNNILHLRGKSGIYIFRNKFDGKVYIGQSVNIYNRYGTHKCRREKTIFSKSLHKIGFENFDFGVLEIVKNLDTLSKREEYWIEFYKSYRRENGYNQSNTVNPFKRKKFTEDHKRKISEALKGINRSEYKNKSIETRCFLKTKCANQPLKSTNLVTNEVITYISTKEVADKTGIARRTMGYKLNKSKEDGLPIYINGCLWERVELSKNQSIWELRKN